MIISPLTMNISIVLVIMYIIINYSGDDNDSGAI